MSNNSAKGAGDMCAYVSTICRMCAVVLLGAQIAQIAIRVEVTTVFHRRTSGCCICGFTRLVGATYL